MFLRRRKLNTIENVIDMPEYYCLAYNGLTFGFGFPGINSIIPIFIVYQNKKNMNDVLVDIHVEVANTNEQIALSGEFLKKFFSFDAKFSKHLVEKNGRMFVSEFRHPNLRHVLSFYDNFLSIVEVEKFLACREIDEYGVELAIALTYKSVDDIKKAKRVRELFNAVREFKTKNNSDSFENKTIQDSYETINNIHSDIEYWDDRMNSTYKEIEECKAVFDKYDINWKNFIKE